MAQFNITNSHKNDNVRSETTVKYNRNNNVDTEITDVYNLQQEQDLDEYNENGNLIKQPQQEEEQKRQRLIREKEDYERAEIKQEERKLKQSQKKGYQYLKQLIGYTGSIKEQFDSVMTDLKSIPPNVLTCHMRTFKAYSTAADNYNRNDCTGLVLSFLASQKEFSEITYRGRLPTIPMIEQSLRCKIVQINGNTDSVFKKNLELFLKNSDGVYIGGIITTPHSGTISHMMLLIVSIDHDKINMSVFDPQEITIHPLYDPNKDNFREVALDPMFHRAKAVACTFFKEGVQIDLREAIKRIKENKYLTKSGSISGKRNPPVLFGIERSMSARHGNRYGNRRNVGSGTRNRRNVSAENRNRRNVSAENRYGTRRNVSAENRNRRNVSAENRYGNRNRRNSKVGRAEN